MILLDCACRNILVSLTTGKQPEPIISRNTLDRHSYYVQSISVDETAEITTGESITLSPTIVPQNAENKNVTWSSSAPTIATVDENGVVTGKKAGTATITATTEDGGLTASCVVTVTKGAGATISGKAASSGDFTIPVTIELLNGEASVKSVTVTGNNASYELSDVESGEYTLRVSKPKHATREYAVSVNGSEVEVNAEIWLIGDLNHDGKINVTDSTQIIRYYNNKTSIFGSSGDSELEAYRLKVADVNSDNKVNVTDSTQITRYYNNKTSIFDTY